MDSQTFYLLFIPGLTLASFGIGTLLFSLAYTQGAFQPETKRGLVSLTVVLVLAVALGILAFKIDHPALSSLSG